LAFVGFKPLFQLVNAPLASLECVKFQVFVQDDLLFLQYFWVLQKVINKLKYLRKNDDESVMRRALIFLLFLVSAPSFAYTINLAYEDSLENCKANQSERFFYCKNKAGDQYLIKSDGWGYFAFKRSKDGKYEPKAVNEIYDSSGNDIFVAPFNRGGFGGYGNGDIEAPYGGSLSQFAQGLGMVHQTFFGYESEEDKVDESDKEVFDFINNVKSEHEARRKHFSSSMNASKMKVELEDGSSLNCQRDPTNHNCSVLNCGKDKKGNDVLLFKDRYANNPYFESFSFKKFELSQDFSRVKKILAPNGEEIIVKNKVAPMGLDSSVYPMQALVPSAHRNNPQLFFSAMEPMFKSSMLQEFDECSPNLKKVLKKALKKIEDDRVNAEMVQLINYANGVIDSNFVNVETLPEFACVHKGVYYTPEAYAQAKKVQGLSSKKAISMKKAQELHDRARARDDIAWDYTMDGCYARAHLMARMFEEEGVHVNKAWLRGQLQIPGEREGMNWGYHVAPLVYVEDGKGGVQEMIIDPSISEKPIPPKDWAALMKVDYKETKQVAFPTPTNTSFFNDTSYAVTTSEPYWPEQDTKLTEEAKMNMASNRMAEYKNGIDPWGSSWQEF
jgi:hypothetical protein